jgi:hypothetical protein
MRFPAETLIRNKARLDPRMYEVRQGVSGVRLRLLTRFRFWSRKLMDLSDVAVGHAIAVSPVNIRHSIELSPSAVSIAREIRFCIIAVVVGFTAASIVKSALVYKRSST